MKLKLWHKIKKIFQKNKNNDSVSGGVHFDFKKESSRVFGEISAPYIRVGLWSEDTDSWLEVEMLVDTGADYTILPKFIAYALGIEVEKECRIFKTVGVGGATKVYFFPDLKVKLGGFERKIPVGFMDSDQVPPLMGRQEFFETFRTTFDHKKMIIFEK